MQYRLLLHVLESIFLLVMRIFQNRPCKKTYHHFLNFKSHLTEQLETLTLEENNKKRKVGFCESFYILLNPSTHQRDVL